MQTRRQAGTREQQSPDPQGGRWSTEVWQIHGGKAVYERVYFDELELLAQLGV
jgi:hypothetical protein